MSCVVCCVHASVQVLRACMCTFQCCMHVCVCACIREYMCTCQCCMPACMCVFVRVLRACVCTCGVRLHVSRLTFHLWSVDFPAIGYEIKGLWFISNLHPPEPPATTGRTAGPRRPRPARPETTPHHRSAAAPAIPLGPLHQAFSPAIPTPPPNHRAPTAGDCQPEVSRLRIPTDH